MLRRAAVRYVNSEISAGMRAKEFTRERRKKGRCYGLFTKYIMDSYHINQGTEVMKRSCPPSSLYTVNARPPLGI